MRPLASLLLCTALLLGGPGPCSARPSPPAAEAQQLDFPSKALATLQDSLTRLQNAHAADPQRDQVKALYDQAVRNLLRLQSSLEALRQPPPPLDAATGRALLDPARRVAQEHRVWMLNFDADPNQLFGMDLAPEDSATILALRDLQKQVYGDITGPPAAQFLEAKAKELQVLARRWEDFYTHATLQEYPWESLANAALDRKRPIDAIPTRQVKLGHPISGVVAYQGRSSSSGPPLMGAELVGLQWFDPDRSYKPSWGIGVLATVKAEGERQSGVGLVVSYRDFKFRARQATSTPST